jgi:SAM-dependent methyltransferase
MENKFINESSLSFKREKPRSIAVSLVYFLTRIGRKIFGAERLLRFYLNSSWMFWRMAFEFSGEIYGGDFHNHAKALNEEFLKNRIKKNDSVIDIGCGIGRWCEVASKYSDDVVGIDYDEGLIVKARQRKEGANVKYIVGDVTKDLDNKKFDLALLIHVIEHIEDADKILQELHNVCHKLIVEVPDFEHDPLNWTRLKQGCRFYTDGDHVREYTQEILTNQLNRNGWNVLEVEKYGGAVLVIAEQKNNES